MQEMLRFSILFLLMSLVLQVGYAQAVCLRAIASESDASVQDMDSLRHVSRQACDFISRNEASTLDGIFTPERASEVRKKLSAAEQKRLDGLRSKLHVSVQRQAIAGVEVAVLRSNTVPPELNGKIAMYVHGGGYVLKSAVDSGGILMAHQLGIPIVSVEYRLAPEHPFPAGLDDCMTVYKALEKHYGADNMVAFGGSAGGGLVLAMLLKAQREGVPLPEAVGLFSPWADLTRTGDSYYSNEDRDPVLKWSKNLEYFAACYAGDLDPAAPLLSPVYGDYDQQFPATLILSGTRDLFLSNAVRLSRKMHQGQVNAELRIWEEMFHGFDLMPDLPEGEQARREMAEFLLRALKNTPHR
ncbi:MAG: epsilon-lactone hydrolase [Desulfovibrionales bacterium]|nr:epsilon-lactone hydrolase [Desulfovibrionales bacterium]